MNQFAFVFPGQGSQVIGMLSNIASHYSVVEKTFREASTVLGYDLWKIVQHGPVEELNRTRRSQPAILSASVAIWRIWKEHGGKMPSIMAGHSLGEYSALACADVIDFDSTVHLVDMRSKFMQESVPEGTGSMAVIIGLDAFSIKSICEESSKDQIVSPVNFNSKKQIVISGHKEAVDRACITCKAAGAKRILPLSISVPSHCILMRSAAKRLKKEMEKIRFCPPTIPVINNVDVKCETTPEAIKNALIRQLYNPVRWDEIIEFIFRKGIARLYEIGPGKILTNLAKQIVDVLTVSALNELETISSALRNVKGEY